MKQSHKPKPAQPKTLLLLAALALSLTACASNPKVVPVTPELPTPPALSTPLPQQTYSTSVEALFKSWRLRLMGTSRISEPSPEAGPHGTNSPAK